MKKQQRKNLLRRAVAFAAAAVMAFSELPLDLMENMDFDFNLDIFDSISVSSQTNYALSSEDFYGYYGINLSSDTISINSASQLIDLTNVNPKEYADKTIVLALTSSDLTQTSLYGNAFLGLGDNDNPFCGRLEINPLRFTLNTAFFRSISTSAVIEQYQNDTSAKVTLISGGEDFCFVDSLVTDDENSVLDLDYFEIENNGNSIKGIINSIGKNASVSLNIGITNTKNDDDEYYTLSILNDTSDAGLICNQMGEDSSLTVSGFTLSDDITATDITVTSSKGNAGGAVGSMASGSQLVFTTDFTFSGTVSSTAMNAGGLVGSGEDCKISTVGGEVTVSGDAKISGSLAVGGIFGLYMQNKDGNDCTDYGSITLSTPSLTDGSFRGGLFGTLENNNGTFNISGKSEDEKLSISVAATGEIYGGLIGSYKSDKLSNTLNITNVNITAKNSDNTGGGVIGTIDSTNTAYVNISGVSVTMNSQLTAGIVENACSGNMLDIGDFTVEDGKKLTSGLVDTMSGGVMRLSGTTNLSKISYDSANDDAQILRYCDGTVVYAQSGWQFNRKTDSMVSDIWSYGEVVRLGNGKLNGLFSFDENAHTVTVANFEMTNISSEEAFAALCVSVQAKESSGALVLTKEYEDSYISEDISITADIDMSGTGITSITRDDGSQTFSGTLDGNGYTLTLNVGEIYGQDSYDSDTVGAGQIYNHEYVGLFGKLQNATIENITVSGIWNVGVLKNSTKNGSNLMLKIGGIAAYALGKNTFNSVTVGVEQNYACDSTNDNRTCYIGGFVGYAYTGCTLNFNTCTWKGTINNPSLKTNFYNGGFIGYTQRSVTVKSVNDTISGSIKITEGLNLAQIGGFIGSMEVNSTNDKKYLNAVSISNMNISGAKISVTSSGGKTGGFLGYDWYNTNVDIDGLTINNSTLSAESKVFGGLVYQAAGYWKVYNSGIEFGTGNNFTGTSGSALLIANGYDYQGTDKALYLEIGLNSDETASAYKIDSSGNTVNVTTTFDEIVGKTKSDEGNGIVSIATVGHKEIDTEKSENTYTKQLSTDYTNANTRYYYNLDKYRSADKTGESTLDLTTIDSGEDMLMWSVYKYAESNIKSYFAKKANCPTITGDINLKGLSYYPVDISESVTFKNATVTFDYENIQSVEKNNKQPSVSSRQHYNMHCGLFSNVTATTSTGGIVIQADTLTFAGTVGKVSDGSGALISGTAKGDYDTTREIPIIVTINLSNIVLDGIKVTSYGNYGPLLINMLKDYTNLSVDGLEQSNSYKSGTKVATSLIGKVGADNATEINLDFKDISLESKTSAAIFSRATLLESFQYEANCSGSYNFNSTDEKVTYGKELSNTDGGAADGRNNGAQYYYYDNRTTAICKIISGDSSADETTYFTSDYLRYVYTVEGTKTTYHEIDINQPWEDLTEGCGTYGDPYIITSGEQLLTVQKILNGLSGGSEIKVDTEIFESISDSDFTGSDDTDYHNNVDSSADSKYHTTYTANDTASKSKLIQYMANAYYEIAEDITLDFSFTGLGEKKDDNLTNAFSGVIFGKNENITVTIETPETDQTTYGGLVKYAGGCVIKDLTVSYGEGKQITMVPPTTTNRSTDQFFGGIIGYAIAGDNIIDNVDITNYPEIIQTNSSYYLISVGGYVGMVGGGSGDAINSKSNGGGVVFKNITNSGLDDKYLNSEYYYTNSYIGRVLDGYACSESEMPSNNGDNYTIAVLSADDKLSVSNTDITVGTAQQLWLLSAIVNSGAGAQGVVRDTTSSTAYSYGKVRTGDYANMGEEISDSVKADLADEKYWSSIESTQTDKQSYLIAKYVVDYGKEYAASLTNNTSAYKLTFSSDIDMSKYGNGFRGVGAAYQDNSNSNIKYRTLPISSIDGVNYTITLSRNVKEYKNETWWVQSLGLFPTINFAVASKNDTATVSNLTISGSVTIEYRHTDDTSGVNYNFIGECSAGGLAGMTANSTGKSLDNQTVIPVKITGLKANDLNVTGAKYAGGFFAVVGQSSRTNRTEKSFNKEISTKVGTYTFSSCGYSNIEIRGRYSAGGFLSVYNGSGTLVISGTSKIDGDKNIIRLTYDAANDIYVWASIDSTVVMKSGFTGAGAIVGNSQTAVIINSDTSDLLIVNNTEITAPRLRHNTDYGVGGIIGTALDNITIKNVDMSGCTVKTDTTNYDDYNFVGKFKKDTSYFLTLPIGGICGQTQEFQLDNINIKNTQILNSGFIGGMIGCANSSTTNNIKNSTLTNVKVYSQGTHSYDGFSEAGGILGKASNGTTNITDCTLTNVSVLSDGYAGGIAGGQRSYLYLTNDEITNCKVATNCIGLQKNPTEGTYVFGDSQTNPTNGTTNKNTSKTDPAGDNKVRNDSSTVSENGCAGGIVGNITKRASDNKLYGLNVLMKNNIIGYYVTDGALGSRVSDADYDTFELSRDNVAVIDSNGNYVAYSSAKFDDEESYTNGCDGILVGDITQSDKNQNVYFLGLSIVDESGGTPYEYWGNNGNTSSTNYVIRADYTHTAEQASQITVKPDNILSVFEKATASNATYVLTSDGAALSGTVSVANKIYTDMTESGSIELNKTYHNVSKYASSFGVNGSKLTTFKNVDTKSSYSTDTSTEDFSVLVIDTNKDSEINKLVRQYASLLTDWDLTSDAEWTSRVNSVDVKSYKWNGTKFISYGVDPTLKQSNKVFSLNEGRHDNNNTEPQFTLIRLQFNSPINNSDKYNLYIPVYVRKVLEYNFSAVVKSGTDYYSSAYDSAYSTALANHGDPVTALVRFTYARDMDTWQTYMESGENLLYNFNKTVEYYTASLPSGTDLVLLDANKNGSSQAFYATQGDSGYCSFNDFTDSLGKNWTPVPLCTLLGVYVDSNASIADTSVYLFEKLENSDKATVKVGDVYYGNPKSVSEIIKDEGITDTVTTVDELNDLVSGKSYARLVVPKSESDTAGVENTQLDEYGYLYEEYYLTIQTKSDNTNVMTSDVAVNTNNTEALGRLIDENGSTTDATTPTLYTQTESDLNSTYILGDVYTQTVTIDGKGSELVDDDTEYIEADITTTIEAKEAFKAFITNNKSVQIEHGFDFDLILYQNENGSMTHSITNFDTNTNVTVLKYTIDGVQISETASPDSATTTLVDFNSLNADTDLRKLIANQQKVEITATVRLEIGDIDEQFKNAYRDSSISNNTAGIAIRVSSKLGSMGSYFTQSATTDEHFYVEKQKSATLSYNAAKDSTFGGTTALGVNPYEIEAEGSQSAAVIDSYAVYNISDVADKLDSYSDKKLAVRYKLSLKRKNDSKVYENVDINEYLDGLTLDSEQMIYDEEGKYYYVNMSWDSEKTSDSVNIQFNVKTGDEFESENLLYTNYEVLLEAQLYSFDDDIDTTSPDYVEGTSANDYIIYTNARILLELFDKNKQS